MKYACLLVVAVAALGCSQLPLTEEQVNCRTLDGSQNHTAAMQAGSCYADWLNGRPSPKAPVLPVGKQKAAPAGSI